MKQNMRLDVFIQKQINANLVNRLCYEHYIPFMINEDTMLNMNEEELFMALWDVQTFIRSEFQDKQFYKMWYDKINFSAAENISL
jgi:hypothetical protein